MKRSLLRNFLMVSFMAALSVLLYSCSKSDKDIQKDVNEKISSMPEKGNVTVDVADGVATLSGQVSDDATKQSYMTAVQSVKGVKSVVNNITITPPVSAAPPPVVIAQDDALTTGVTDAVKDFPGVNAQVNEGVITLTGTIERSRLKTLMQSLNTLKPKRINNQLTIK